MSIAENNISLTDDSASNAGESELKNYMKFSTNYTQQLSDIEYALGSSSKDAWNTSVDALVMQTHPHERACLTELIATENKVLNKVSMAFVSLCMEVKSLEEEAETRFYDALLFYGEGLDGDVAEGNDQIHLGRILPLLQRLLCFVHRVKEVLKNMLQQIAALYNKEHCNINRITEIPIFKSFVPYNTGTLPKVIDVSHIHLNMFFESIGSLLCILITLDEIVMTNVNLKEHWVVYKRMLKSVYNTPSKFDVNKDKIKPLEKVLARIEKHILSGGIFQHCIDQNFDDSGIPVHKNTMLADEFFVSIKNIFSTIENKSGEQLESCNQMVYVNACCLFALHYHIYRNLDKKLLKQLLDFQRKLPCVSLFSNVLFFMDDFILTKIPASMKVIDKRQQDALIEARSFYLTNKQQSLTRDSQLYFMALSQWLVKMESIHQQEKSLEDVNSRTDIYLEGITLARTMRNVVMTVMNLHVSMQKAMSLSQVLSLFRIIGMIKAIEGSFYTCSVQLTESEMNIIQNLQFQTLKILQEVKGRMVADKKYSDRKLDILTALKLACSSINGSPSTQRLIIARLSVAFANQSKTFRDEELQLLNDLLYKFEIVSKGLNAAAQASSNLSFFYWHKELLSVYLSNVCKNPSEASTIQNIFSMLNDSMLNMERCEHLENPNHLISHYQDNVMNSLKQNLLTKVCKEIENDLRLSVHRHLKLDDRNPYKVGLKGLRLLLATKPVRFLNSFFHIKAYVAHYLDVTFYNLTTVALHDWKTYGQMRHIAEQKYQIHMQEVHLPNQTLEQGLDILEIMRNIHVFVSKYLYNLNNQIFVERSSNNKHLNTINIRHIANSIRTHGTGIMNTTFLYDEHIKSRLIKDIRFFRENKEALQQRYPYARAERFNKGIRKLGLTEDGQSYLDQFRLLISHIGNAMGYIRMVRSGGLHFCSNAICFVPDIEDIVNFHELVKDETLGSEVDTSVKQLDSVIDTLAKNSAEGSDYFKMLVEVFASEFRTKKNLHLRNFYAILPPLTLNFVEHSISCKEKMNKKNKVGAAFTDDGFAMGVAYILKLLDQYSEFDTLHWFQSVRQKHEEDMKKQSSKSSVQNQSLEDEKLAQATSLTFKRIEIYKREFDLLYYSLSSARIFFQAVNKSEENSETKESEKPANDSTNSANGENSNQ